MHPAYKLLHPHLRYTVEINDLAREALINANGIIEKAFSPGKYSIELCSAAYDQLWQFDLQEFFQTSLPLLEQKCQRNIQTMQSKDPRFLLEAIWFKGCIFYPLSQQKFDMSKTLKLWVVKKKMMII
ncbi:Linoleate 13S-lipoxygenase 2-1 [Forsythia ovata]|uniref:Linoleate 13S-lipoxygenase 2-1 n=1 Tax=Forsythia ovata TaxID=205694 RepID=A0ABD1RHH3_9LAMI